MGEVNWRPASREDREVLSTMNLALIEDEGHRASREWEVISGRMGDWLAGDEYAIVLFEDEARSVVGYAVFREEEESIYLRQLFVCRGERRKGVGRKMVDLLEREIFPADKRVTLSVLVGNEVGVAFWRSVGFSDYCMVMEKAPGERRGGVGGPG